jgi:hypothetical protein
MSSKKQAGPALGTGSSHHVAAVLGGGESSGDVLLHLSLWSRARLVWWISSRSAAAIWVGQCVSG